jgi:hypothetical protein
MVSVVREGDALALARALDWICERAEQAETSAREALIAIVDALNREELRPSIQRLRENAADESLLALERLIRDPVRPSQSSRDAEGARVPERPQGQAAGGVEPRLLTLGERKFLARRPDRDTLQRLMSDTHPDVISRVLRNPRLTEDDVVRLAARRPGNRTVLAEIARATHWLRRSRVRVALLLNPATPPDIAVRIAGLLLRTELQLVARSAGVAASLRALCMEHLERRPPVAGSGNAGSVQ